MIPNYFQAPPMAYVQGYNSSQATLPRVHTKSSNRQSYRSATPSYPSTTQQPQSTPTMRVTPLDPNRNARNMTMGKDGRDWSNGLCGCCDEADLCIIATLCPCVIHAQNKRRLEHLNDRGVPDPEQGGSCCSGDCCLHACLTSVFGLGWVLQIGNRRRIRSRYQIKGGGCGDCCTSLFCTPCALTQERIELELEERAILH